MAADTPAVTSEEELQFRLDEVRPRPPSSVCPAAWLPIIKL
jgi:hypothetical protein